LGFKRLTSLPERVRNNINLACILKGQNDTNQMKEFLGTLSDEEFKNWMKVQ
jgi:hypothetical protein